MAGNLIGEAFIRVGADTGGFRSEVQRDVEAAVAGVDADVEVHADADGLRGEVSRAAAAAGAGQEIDIELNVEDGGSIGRSSSALNNFISSAGRANISVRFLGNVFRAIKWPLLITGATLAAQAIAALGGAAVAVISSLSSLAGVLAALPGLFSAVAQGIGSVLLASSGVGKALKAMGQAGIKGGGGVSGGADKAAAALKRQQDATERVEDATRSLARTERDAARDIEDANQAIADAVEDLARAKEEAADESEESTRRIEDATRALARAEEDAADRVIDANRRIEDAKRDLIDVQQDAVRAQEDLTRARERASQRLEDLQLRSRQLAVDENQALRDVQRAQQLLDRNRGSAGSQILVDQLEEAKIALEKIRLEQGRAQDEMQEFNEKGVDGTEEVQSAEERLADSLERVADAERKIQDATEARADAQVESLERIQDAQRNLQDAQRDALRQQEDSARRITQAERALTEAREDAADTQIDAQERIEDAQRALTEAIEDSKEAMEDFGSAGGGAMSAVASAMAALPKSAQEFVKFLYSLKPLLDELRTVAADNLFPGLTNAIRMSLPLFPIFRDAVGATAKAIADLAVEGARLVTSPLFAGDVRDLMAQNVISIRQFGTAGLLLGDALRHIMVAAIPLVNMLGLLAIRLAENVQVFAQTNRENGKMQQFFEGTARSIESVIAIGANLFTTFFNIGRAGFDLGNDLVASFVKITKGWAEATGSVTGQANIKEFFDGLRPSITALGGLITDLGGALFRVLQSPELPNFINKLRNDLLPTLEKILTTASRTFGPAFADALSGFSSLLQQLVSMPGLPGFISSMGLLAKAIAGLLEHVPGLKGALAVFISITGIAKAAQFVGFAAGLAKTGVAAKILTGAFLALRVVVTGIAVALGAPVAAVIAIGVAIAGLAYLVFKYWDEIKAFTISVWNSITEFFSGWQEKLKVGFETVVTFVVNFLKERWEFVKNITSTVWNGIKDFFSGVWEGIKNIATTALTAVVQFVLDRFNSVRSTTMSIWNGIKGFFSDVWNGIKSTVSSAVGDVLNRISEAWNNVKSRTSEAWENVKRAVSDKVGEMLDTVRRLPGDIVSGLGNLVSLLYDKGKDIVQGLIDGVKSMGKTLIRAILNLIPGPIRDVVADALDIHSPSGVFIGFGRNIVQGMIEGIGAQQPALLRELQGMATDMAKTNFAIPDIEAAVNATGRGSITGIDRNGTQRQFGNVIFNIYDAHDPNRVAAAVANVLNGKGDPMVQHSLTNSMITATDKRREAKNK